MDHSAHHDHDSKSSGADVCMVENRECENVSGLEKTLVANHVWETCKPSSNFIMKRPTVSARRVQLMRAHLQSNRTELEELDSQQQQQQQQQPRRQQQQQPPDCGTARRSLGKPADNFYSKNGRSGQPINTVISEEDDEDEGECEGDNEADTGAATTPATGATPVTPATPTSANEADTDVDMGEEEEEDEDDEGEYEYEEVEDQATK